MLPDLLVRVGVSDVHLRYLFRVLTRASRQLMRKESFRVFSGAIYGLKTFNILQWIGWSHECLHSYHILGLAFSGRSRGP